MWYVQLYGTTIIYNTSGTTIVWQKIYDLDNQNGNYMIKSSVLLEHEWSERQKVKMKYDTANKENQWNNEIKQRNRMMKNNTNKLKKQNK